MDDENLLMHAVKFGFGRKYEDVRRPELYDYSYFIENRGLKGWAVTDIWKSCYDSEINEFIWEPSPFARTDKFLETTRFSLDEAIKIVQRYAMFCYDYCIFLNLKEFEQDAMKTKEAHVCMKYNQQVTHGIFHPKLIRCKECLRND
jgi:hypothetical protein